MTGRPKTKRINHWNKVPFVLGILAAFAAVPARAGQVTLTTASSGQTALTIAATDWRNQTIDLSVEHASSVSTASTIFQAETTKAGSDTTAPTVQPARTPAEAPMPPAAISGSVMLVLVAIGCSLRKKLAF